MLTVRSGSVRTLALTLVLAILCIAQLQLPLLSAKGAYETKLSEFTKYYSSEVKKHLEFFASRGSRVVGYPGYYESVNYIIETLKSYGYDVYVENFTVTVPVDHGSYIEILSPYHKVIKAYALAPNLVETCYTPNGITAGLVYIGHGKEEMNGKDISGKIVVLEFDSGYEWMKAISLGAKAVIFVINPLSASVTQVEAADKVSEIPIYAPRLAVDWNDFKNILLELKAGKEVEAKIVVNMTFENVVAYNIIALKKGSKYPSEVIALTAYFDSWSVAPAWSPGADEALGISSLLAIAKLFKDKEPLRTVAFIAFSGHHQALAGAREFAFSHAFEKPLAPINLTDIKLMIHLDPSAYYEPKGETRIALLDAGAFYGATPENKRLAEERFFRNPDFGILDLVEYLYREKSVLFNLVTQEGIITATPYYNPDNYQLLWRKYFETEPLVQAGGYGIAIAADTYSPLRGTPADTYSSIASRLPNSIYYAFIAEVWLEKLTSVDAPFPLEFNRVDQRSIPKVIVSVEEYSEAEQKYHPMPEALVVAQFNFISSSVNHQIIIKTDKHGIAVLKALAPHNRGPYSFYAYKFDYKTGDRYMPNMGETALPSFGIRINAPVYTVRTSLFKAATIILFDVLDPESLQPLIPIILVVNHNTKSSTRYFGLNYDLKWHTMSRETLRPYIAIYVSADPSIPPGPPWDIIIFPSYSMYHLVVLTNSGYGITPRGCEQVLIKCSPLVYAKEFQLLCSQYMHKAMAHQLYLPTIAHYFEIANETLERAEEALAKKEYEKGLALAVAAWSYYRAVYDDLRRTMIDTSFAAAIFLLLALPFAFLAERLFFNFESLRKRALAIVFLLVTSTAIMYFVHPALALASNAPLVVIAFVLIFVIMVPLGLIMSRVIEAAKKFRLKATGVHFSDISRASALVMAASLGAGNLRRRKLRTSLTMISLMVVVATLVSTISVTTTKAVTLMEHYKLPEHAITYDGLLIVRGEIAPVPLEAITQFKGELSGTIKAIAPRAYLERGLIQFIRPEIMRTGERREGYDLVYKGRIIVVMGILGLSQGEKYTFIEDALKKGYIIGQYFSSDEAKECLVSDIMATQYNISIGDYITFEGENLKVVGIFNTEWLESIRDPNNDLVTPLAIEAPGGGRVQALEARRLKGEEIIIVPYKVVLRHHGAVFSIAVVLKDPSKVYEIAQRLTYRTKFKIYATENKDVRVYAKVLSEQVIGREALIPVGILVFIILNTCLSAVYERRREVSILSSIGLSPTHVAGLFLLEFMIIGVVSGVLGYLFGIILPKLIPGLVLNTSSSWVAGAVGLSIIITLTAAIYPVSVASKAVTPSFERKWRIETVGIRRGDRYLINIPVVVSPLELDGLVNYLIEYFNLHRSETAADFMIDKIELHKKVSTEGETTILHTTVKVKPFDSGVVMSSNLHFHVPAGSQIVKTTLDINRVSGIDYVYRRGVRKFADAVRKQLLMWRALTLADRKRYIKTAKEELSKYLKEE